MPHSYIQLSWQLQRFFFSLYTHVTRVFLNVSFSIFFTFSTFLSPPTSGHWTFTLIVSLYDFTYCSRYLSLSTYCFLFLSSYAQLSLSLSKKISFSHYKSTIVNNYYIFFYFFLTSNLWIWVLKSSTKFGFNTNKSDPSLKPFKQWLEAPKIGKAPKF